MYQDVEADSELGAVEARSLLGFFFKNPGRLIPLRKKYKLLKMPFPTVENVCQTVTKGGKTEIHLLKTALCKSRTYATSR